MHAVGDISNSTTVNLEAAEVMESAVARLGEQIEMLRQEMAVFQVRRGADPAEPAIDRT